MKKMFFVLGILSVLFLYSLGHEEVRSPMLKFNEDLSRGNFNILAITCIDVRPLSSFYYSSNIWGMSDLGYGLTVNAFNPDEMEFFAPIHLPDGAVIKAAAVVFYDNSTLSNIEVRIERVYATSMTYPEEMFSFTSSGLTPVSGLQVYKNTSITSPTIDNEYCYFVRVNFDNQVNEDVAFRGIFIAYQ